MTAKAASKGLWVRAVWLGAAIHRKRNLSSGSNFKNEVSLKMSFSTQIYLEIPYLDLDLFTHSTGFSLLIVFVDDLITLEDSLPFPVPPKTLFLGRLKVRRKKFR